MSRLSSSDCPGGSRRVAFLGPDGTYTHQAAFERFGAGVEYVRKGSIADTLGAIPVEASIAVIPAENSTYGSVIETLDVLRLSEMGKEKVIVGEKILQIQHCLVVARGTQLSDIANVLSHEQALGQCSDYLKNRLPHAKVTKMSSTAAAAEAILGEEARGSSAAICSEGCSRLYPDLELLEKGIQNENNNFTRFWIIAESSSSSTLDLIRTKAHNALLRISPHPDEPVDLLPLLVQLNLPVQRIDRRPSTQGTPFHDVYFVHVSQQQTSGSNGIAEEPRSWVDEVNNALDNVRALGWDGLALGFW